MKTACIFAILALMAAAPALAAGAPADDATTHCTNTGGVVVIRTPAYGTNGGTPPILRPPQTLVRIYRP